MSAIVGLFFDEVVFIGTDTLATRSYQEGDVELKPFSFVPKVFHLPQLKCAFGCIGYQNIGAKLYEFITQRFIGKDINSIVNVGLWSFKKFVDEAELAQLPSSIYLYGYDHTLKKFKGYRAHFGQDEGDTYTWIPLRSYTELPDNNVFVMVPPVEVYWEKLKLLFPEKESCITYQEFIERLVIIQKDEDDERAPNEQVGIGGDIVLTTLYMTQNNHFGISSEVAYEFPDKENVGEYMMELLEIQNASNR